MRSWLLVMVLLSSPAFALSGDLNGDGYVNVQDLLAVAQSVGRGKPYVAAHDLNGDGSVNIFDLTRVSREWGKDYWLAAPSRTDLQPSGTLPAGTTSAVLSLSTNVSATCARSTMPNTAFTSMTPFTTTGGTAHSANVTVQDGQSYTFSVKCRDSQNRTNRADATISFSVERVVDPSGPVVDTSVIPSQTTMERNEIQATASDPDGIADITITTEGLFWGTPTASCANTTSCTTGFLSYVAGSHTYTVTATDTTGRSSTVSGTINLPFRLYGGAPMGVVPLGTREVTLRLITSAHATCGYSTTPGQPFDSLTPFTVTGASGHHSYVPVNGGSYVYYVKCSNPELGVSDDYAIRFTVPAGEYQVPAAAPSSEFISPSAEVQALLGPQLRSGSPYNPWPFFDQNQIDRGLSLGQTFSTAPSPEAMYYDMGLTLYAAYYRTGDERFLTYARNATDWWYDVYFQNGTIMAAPRSEALIGLMLRALDGRPEMWPYIEDYTDRMMRTWVERYYTRDRLAYGIRDGGYTLLYAARLGQVHPNASVREEYRARALQGAKEYYVRLQYPDGSWRWNDSVAVDSQLQPHAQPFMYGLLLDGMVAVHEQTGDPEVKTSILAAVESAYRDAYRFDEVPERPGVQWRGNFYFVYCTYTCPGGRSNLTGGWDTNSIRDVREANPTNIHAYGYAYHITGDPKYLVMGDELAASSWGKGQGPGADAFYSLMDYRGKEYNQNYRTGGRYMAYRVMPVNE